MPRLRSKRTLEQRLKSLISGTIDTVFVALAVVQNFQF